MLLHLLERGPAEKENSVEIGGAHWHLATYDLNTCNVDTIPFTCVSYSWGKGKIISAFHCEPFLVSDRTLSVVATLVSRRPSCTRIWVDAFCVPLEGYDRIHTLQSMGYIYAVAQEVVAVLSSATRPVLTQMAESDRLSDANLDILEADDWITRAWTYQEAVNSKGLAITCEGEGAIVDGTHFFDCLGFTLTRLQAAPYTNRVKHMYPRLDTFQELMADYMVAAYQQRSALQVMTNVDRRLQNFHEDHFYAMIGAISDVRSSFGHTADPCEVFMSVCEKKGDYSFVYSSAKRDTSPKKRWRPAPGDHLLPAVMPWHCFGESQPGHEEGGSLYLDEVHVVKPQPLGDRAREFVESWLKLSKMPFPEGTDDATVAVPGALESMGFLGSLEGIPTMNGFFFPIERMYSFEGIQIIVATKVRWTFGAPGLVCIRGDVDIFIPGVFFGIVEAKGTTSFRLS
ncbi:hypothetical protein GGS20DRAFT_220669 [Poronia punctata]|nr:hypothetical protein GGS20DRAFT_220669 [Poronia punctata]